MRYYQQAVYSAHNLSALRFEGDNNSPECAGLFLSSTEASDDGWNPVDLIFNAVRFPRLTKGQMECSGVDNCVIVNPPQYTTAWAVKNINRQTHMADNESLNIGQTIGTHNSVISRVYTSTSFMTNVSYSDPNQYISITDQLNFGVRQLEIDFLYDGDFKICHYKSDDTVLDAFAQLFVCDSNTLLQDVFVELNTWILNHPNELVYVYFDNTQPWTIERLGGFQEILNTVFEHRILTKNNVRSDDLPTSLLTRNDIVHKFKKNIILYSHNPDPVFNSSPYVFFKVAGSQTANLHDDHNVGDFYAVQETCGGDRFCLQSNLFNNDKDHSSLHVIREDRTHLEQQKGTYQDRRVYLTNNKVQNVMSYPINIVNFDKLSLYDARLESAVWSFEFPYPLDPSEGGTDYAFIDPASGKFSNRRFTETTFDVLCFNQVNRQWFTIQSGLNSCSDFNHAYFATPVSGYQLDQIRRAKIITHPTLVNYKRNEFGEWIANSGNSLKFSAN